jgi:aminoglycoside phosphotransferase (APT) family kinase protein
MRVQYCLMLPCGSGVKIVADPRTFELPTVELSSSPPHTFIERFTRYVAQRHRCHVHVLRWISPTDFSEVETSTTLLCDVRSHTPSSDLRWISDEDICPAQNARPVTAYRASFLHYALQKLPAQPWTYPQWIEQVTTWITTQLPALAATKTVTITQVRIAPSSTVLRIRVGDRYFYFKAVRQAYGYEPALIQSLAKVVPLSIAPVVATDQARGWYLCESVTGHDFCRISAIRPWKSALKQLAYLQKVALELHADLAHLGVPDFGTTVLEQRASELLETATSVLSRSRPRLIRKARTDVAAVTLRVSALATKLRYYGIEDSIVHSDLNESNILTSGSHIVFIDWTYATLSHPFLVLSYTCYLTEHRCRALNRCYAVVRDSYLQEWTSTSRWRTLRECYDVAGELAYFYGRLINLWILLERRSEMPGEICELRRLIEDMSQQAQRAF